MYYRGFYGPPPPPPPMFGPRYGYGYYGPPPPPRYGGYGYYHHRRGCTIF